jgi:hypothetical protein
VTTIETRQYKMLARVRDFGNTHRDLFPDSGPGGQQFAAVAEAVKQLSEQAMSNTAAAREGASTKAKGRRALIDRLEAISRTARVIAEGTPGLEDKFHLPDPQTDEAVLTAGRVFARDAAAFKSQFVGHGMPETFLADLDDLVVTFEKATRHRDAGRNEQTAARASIAAALESGMAAVQRLDVIVANRLQDDPVTTAMWERERRVGYPRVKSAAPTPTVAPAAAAEPAAASALAPTAPVSAPQTT